MKQLKFQIKSHERTEHEDKSIYKFSRPKKYCWNETQIDVSTKKF